MTFENFIDFGGGKWAIIQALGFAASIMDLLNHLGSSYLREVSLCLPAACPTKLVTMKCTQADGKYNGRDACVKGGSADDQSVFKKNETCPHGTE